MIAASDPAPNFFTAPNIEYDSQGTGSEAAITASYILRYRFLYEEVGAERTLSNIFQGFIGKLTEIVDVFIDNDATADGIHLQVVEISGFGVVTDPVGNEFHGCEFGISVMEFVN